MKRTSPPMSAQPEPRGRGLQLYDDDRAPRASRLGLSAGLSAGLVVGVAAAVIALSACGGGGSATPPSALPLAALEPVADGALVPKVREMLRSRQSARVANPGVSFDRFAVTATGGLTGLTALPLWTTIAALAGLSRLPLRTTVTALAGLRRSSTVTTLSALLSAGRLTLRATLAALHALSTGGAVGLAGLGEHLFGARVGGVGPEIALYVCCAAALAACAIAGARAESAAGAAPVEDLHLA